MEEFLTLALPWELSFSRVHVPRIPSVYLALRANDKVRRFINIHLHYITCPVNDFGGMFVQCKNDF